MNEFKGVSNEQNNTTISRTSLIKTNDFDSLDFNR